ncbi:hypothetical protein [Pedobacter ureilyticus]|uniref:Uncharacterized protein n=1 Tax=Pedobacter ureilyticus TaxID=1393051 RepID=A0ABW9J493_9SPHI|nr:hypothetical protein [Pedobacter helvus]
MERKQLTQFSKAYRRSGQRGHLFYFSFRTSKPVSFYPFDRLYALKPKNPV